MRPNITVEVRGSYTRRVAFPPPTPQVRAPGLLWMFGEKGEGQFALFEDVVVEGEVEQLKELFPEAEFVFGNAERGGTSPGKIKQTREKRSRR